MDVRGLKAKSVTTEIKTEVKENNTIKFKFDKPKVLRDKISLLFLSFIKVNTDERNNMKGNVLVIILGIIIRDNNTGSIMPTS
tara:strand:- start:658 stop:906 length:249 start_codon:yes stop_codon:yes gene_type:complete